MSCTGTSGSYFRAIGSFSYEVVETKLARSTKARAILQLCFYSELLSKIQGIRPDWMHVVLGGGAKPDKFLVSRYIAFFRKLKRDFEEASRISGIPIQSRWSSVTFVIGSRSVTNDAGLEDRTARYCGREFHHLNSVAGFILRHRSNPTAQRGLVCAQVRLRSISCYPDNSRTRQADCPLRYRK
jgi:hypothetical protein